ncbi:hypothetical protein GCM10010994_60430 [Chelatococcus reniformis]|uniref:Uncharacterized protein n=1 Tax=Chelatococcus reniformis TaxID=1494448 RepID=A0A916XR53_9HYPH|nr:hypothetical protein GCM10010994_60430 [Chelatococcus reniformis]
MAAHQFFYAGAGHEPGRELVRACVRLALAGKGAIPLPWLMDLPAHSVAALHDVVSGVIDEMSDA